MKLLKLIGHILFIALLTILTQVGGLLWLVSVFIAAKFQKRKRYVFLIVYLVCNLLFVPMLAPYFGRTKLPVIKSALKPQNQIYPLLFRNYVDNELYDVLQQSTIDLAHLGIKTTYLDANFPFFNGFPLFPHLSHNDGKKIDISFMYLENNNKTDKKPSLMGYGAFTSEPNPTSNQCKKTRLLAIRLNKILIS